MPEMLNRLQAVARCALEPTERLVLMVLAQYTDDESALTLVSWDTIRAATGLARSTVADVLDALRRGGTLERLSTPGHATRYRVAWDAPGSWRSERAPRRRGDPSASRTRPPTPSATRTRPPAPRPISRQEVRLTPELFEPPATAQGCRHCGHHAPSATQTPDAGWASIPGESPHLSASRTRPADPSAARTRPAPQVEIAEEEPAYIGPPSAARTRPADPPSPQAHLFPEPSLPPTGGSLPPRLPDPAWTPKDCAPWSSAEIIEMVCRCIAAIRGKAVAPRAAGGDARAVLALWRDVDRPAPGSFIGEVAMVAAWAQRSQEAAALNDIRGIDRRGERWGADRSRDVKTLTNPESWGDRLERARDWAARGRSDAEMPGGDAAAWEAIIAAIQEFGTRNARVRHLLTDQQARALATLGGVHTVGSQPLTEWPALRAAFLRQCAELGRRAELRSAA